MKELSSEQTEIALTRLECLMRSRAMTQQQLADLSSVSQPAISKFLHRESTPNGAQLTRLFHALGLKMESVLELDAEPDHIFGYLATPLTGVVSDPRKDKELRSVVRRIREVASDHSFCDPPFDIYWPGDHTHPVKNADLVPSTVYLMDRSRASTNDFVVMFCAEPSFGVGQENEIATQAGIPIIRLVPDNLSRMMTGSFAHAQEIRYAGTLATEVAFDSELLRKELRAVRITYYRHRALYRSLNGHGFGERLRQLIDKRADDFIHFASDVGVSLSYVHALVDEPIGVSNPSTNLLKRMAARLDTSVSYLLGEEAETDTVWIESQEALRAWTDKNPDVSAADAFHLRDEWRQEYRLNRRHVSVSSFRRKTESPMTELDWDRRYQAYAKSKAGGGLRLF